MFQITKPHLCSISKSYHVMPYLTSRPTRAASPTQLHQLSCKFPCPTLPHLLSYKSSPSYTTSPVVLQVFPHPTLPHQLSVRVPTSYATSSAVLQEFPHPTLPHQLSCKSSHILATLHHQSSRKCSHILRYLVSCPASVPTSYTTHQLSCKNYQFV